MEPDGRILPLGPLKPSRVGRGCGVAALAPKLPLRPLHNPVVDASGVNEGSRRHFNFLLFNANSTNQAGFEKSRKEVPMFFCFSNKNGEVHKPC